MGWRIYPRHRLDISLRQVVYGAAACAFARTRRLDGEESIVCCSVRSGFELLLSVLDLPPGSEILASAITHPDMARISERHRLRVVPVDIDASTLAPSLELLEAAVTERTRAVMFAHLFGVSVDLDPVV